MDSDTWNAYHIVSNRVRSVCYSTRQLHFRRKAEMTVNALISTASSQLDAMNDLKVTVFSPFTILENLCQADLPSFMWTLCVERPMSNCV